MARRRKTRNKWPKVIVVIAVIWLAQESRFYLPKHIRPPAGIKPVTVTMKTTSYCHCRRCCSYKWFLFIPYQKTGSLSYRLKHVGITASGAMTRPGSIAADTSIYPHGTIMHIPGYGYGRVEDTGGAVKGHHIDLYRPNHWFARQWGVRTKKVKVWLPPGPHPWFFDPTTAKTNSEPPSMEAAKTNIPPEKAAETNISPEEASEAENPLP